jgi:benzylsuccinate CoA-transferase BbsF subunit
MKTMASLPLDGIRVLEFGTGYVGPVLCQQLADFGADVIKVETQHRLDFMRPYTSFYDVNRNKRSVLLDAKGAEGYEIAVRLVQRSDVVVENLSAGAMHRLKLDYQSLLVHRPDVIMISLQGLGATEERSTTFGQNIPPFAGLTYLWNHPDAPRPVGSQLFHPDYFGGLQGACAVMAALDHRRRTGQGQYIDAPQVAMAGALIGPAYLDWTVNGEVARPQGNRGLGAPQGCYPCRGEDRWCVIAVENDEQWGALVEALDAPAWSTDARFAAMDGRHRHADELDAHLAAWTGERTPEEVCARLRHAGVPCGPVYDTRDVVQDPHLNARGFLVRVQHPGGGELMHGGPPAHLSETPAAIRRPAPTLGQHTAEVLMEVLGLSQAEVDRLQEARALW